MKVSTRYRSQAHTNPPPPAVPQSIKNFVAKVVAIKKNAKISAKSVKILNSPKDKEKVLTCTSKEVPNLANFSSAKELDDTLAAVVELRRQYHSKPVPQKRPFPGLRGFANTKEFAQIDKNSPGRAYEFMRQQYGEEIDNGRLSPSRLREIDIRLYASVANEAEAQGKTVSDFLKAGSQDELYDRRRQAAAAILAAPVSGISSFFHSLRDQRRPKPQQDKAR